MKEAYNVCNEIRCPYSSPGGCDRYTISNHCHLAYPQPGQKREGLEPNQYWLFADVCDPRIDINQLKQENHDWLEQDEHTQALIKFNRKPFNEPESVNAA